MYSVREPCNAIAVQRVIRRWNWNLQVPLLKRKFGPFCDSRRTFPDSYKAYLLRDEIPEHSLHIIVQTVLGTRSRSTAKMKIFLRKMEVGLRIRLVAKVIQNLHEINTMDGLTAKPRTDPRFFMMLSLKFGQEGVNIDNVRSSPFALPLPKQHIT